MLRAAIQSMRPHQWVKNGFVLAPLLFARRLTDPGAALAGVLALLAFCFASSAVYLFNDLCDLEEDRRHPRKRLRAIASGALPLPAARWLSGGLAAASLTLGLFLGWHFAGVVLLFLLLNLAYTLGIKRVVFLDVLAIALGFILRVAGGGLASDVPLSGWLLLCTLLLATFLGLGKRKQELRSAGAEARSQRSVLAFYRAGSLDVLLALTATATMASYIFYTMSEHAVIAFSRDYLPVTIPSIMLGILRFLQLSDKDRDAGSPTDAMLRDPLFVVNLAVWVVLILLHLYGGVSPA